MRVSMVMPIYNGEAFLAEALSSVVNQSYPVYEAILVDDGSSDRSRLIAEEWKGRFDRCVVIAQSNAGLAGARNSGIREATGDLVAFLDHDDLWSPDKLMTQVPLFADQDVGIAGSLMTYLGREGRARGVTGEPTDGRQADIAAARLMPFVPSSMVCRLSILQALGGFDAELSRTVPIDDLDLVSRVAANHKVVCVPRSLGLYRLHENSLMATRFYELQRATLFLQARVRERASGGELLWSDWSAKHPLSAEDVQRWRGRFLFREAGVQWVCGHRGSALVSIARAALLSPGYTARRLLRRSRFLVPRLRRAGA